MNKTLKIGLAIVIILIVVGMYYVLRPRSVATGTAVDCTAGVTCFTNLGATGTFQADGATIFNGAVTNSSSVTIGTGNTAFTGLVGGTCNLTGMNASQGASTTKAYSCTGITGLTSSFKVIASLASSTPSTTDTVWSIVSAKASTTAGAADIVIYHGGVAAVPSVTSVGSSTVIFGFK